MTKIFATGITGYIGGDALHALAKAHPEYEITCSVRNSDKGALVAKEYPGIRLVYGDLDGVEMIEEEAGKADVVLNLADADHAPAARAIIRGLSSSHSASKPGFLIHCSGTGNLLLDDMSTNNYGEDSDKIYDDLQGVGKVTSLPDEAPHRNVDKIVLAASEETGGRVKTAIVCPPTIYGWGRGPGNKRSHQLPELARCTLERGKGFQVGKGRTRWSNVHVFDLSDLYLKLVENAAAGGSLAEWPDKPALWGEEGYFFSEDGEHVWGDIARAVAKEAKKQGLINTDGVESISSEEAAKLTAYGHGLWGANSRSRAKRAREVLRWKPAQTGIEDEVKAAIEVEARLLGLKPGHAKVAAGDA